MTDNAAFQTHKLHRYFIPRKYETSHNCLRHGQRRINSNVEQSDHSPAKVAQSATSTFILVPSLFKCTGNRRNKQAVVVMPSLLPEWPQTTWQLPLPKVLEDSNRTGVSTNRWKTLRQTLGKWRTPSAFTYFLTTAFSLWSSLSIFLDDQ